MNQRFEQRRSTADVCESARRGRAGQRHVDLHFCAAVAIGGGSRDINPINRKRECDTGLQIPNRELDFLFRGRRLRELHLPFASGVGVDSGRLEPGLSPGS